MSTTLPVTFRGSPLPLNQRYTPQQFFDAIVARLSLQSDTSFSIFTIGSTPPSTNVGPFLKDGITWYVWDPVSGSYVPEVIEFRSLRYVASVSAPSQALYTFWIKLNGSGKAVGIYYYSGGAWKDVYEDAFATINTNLTTNYSTTAQMNTAIAAAVAGFNASINQSPFRAYKTASAQIYTAGSGDEKVVFDAVTFDPDGVFASSEFTAAVTGYHEFKASAYVALDSGTPTAIDRQLKLRVNGAVVTRKNVQVNDLTGGQTIDISDEILLNAGDVVDVVVNVTSTGASDWSLLNDSTTTFFTGKRTIKP